jgi:shikimate kinase
VSARPNIVLIGMPGAGKSTVGVLLAKALSLAFVDTDVVIQAREGRRLQEILDAEGVEAFRRLEERHVLEVRCEGHVIATGGSVVYSDAAMRHLQANGWVVFLEAPGALLAARLDNLSVRGVARAAGQSLESLLAEREPLYRKYADVTLACEGLTHEGVVAAVIGSLPGPSAAIHCSADGPPSS